MKPVVILLLLLVVGAGAWYFLGTEKSPSDTPTIPDAPEPGKAKKAMNDGEGPSLVAPRPVTADMQMPEMSQLKTPANALLIAMGQNTWTKTVEVALGAMEDLGFSTWFLHTADGGPVAGEARGLEPLTAAPTAAYLEKNDIRALFFDSVDPNVFPRAFWDTVARRVRGGNMGLYIRPNQPPAPPGAKAPAVHPALEHPVLKDLLPVTRALPVSGTPLPGVFIEKAQPLRVTREGARHPATRFVTNPDDSLQAWARAGVGDGAFATKFVYPVQETRDDAQVLVNVAAATDIPAIIASPPSAPRVLWMGNVDFGSKVHYNNEKRNLQYILLNQWILWLVGQADE